MNAISNLIEKDILNERTLHLKIIGDGAEHNNLLLKAQELNIDNKTEFLGWIDDPERLAIEYISSDIFVLPSKEAEGFPRVIDEAMYYEIPVVTTNLGYGNSLEQKKNIFFIEPNSIVELEKAIEEVITNDGLRRRMIENGKKRIENIMGEESTAEQHARIVKGNLSSGEDSKDDREAVR
jgi:glycosyltransferase involved in cell wall biosynthesis